MKATLRMADAFNSLPQVVVVCDICSSTMILEDLRNHDHMDEWILLLGFLELYLRTQCKNKLNGKVYKFLGDGWLLFLPASTPKPELFGLLNRVSARYHEAYKAGISPLLTQEPHTIGMTFGIDMGLLSEVESSIAEVEYVGKALNVACRLQSLTKEVEDRLPEYTALISKHCFNSLPGTSDDIKAAPIQHELRNMDQGRPQPLFRVRVFEPDSTPMTA